MVSTAASAVRLKSSCSSTKMPSVVDHVVQHGDQRADAELPFEAEPDVDHDGDHGGEHGADAALHQLVADLGPDRFGAAQLVLAADRVLDQLDRDLLAPFGALLRRHVDLGGVGRAARQLALLRW